MHLPTALAVAFLGTSPALGFPLQSSLRSLFRRGDDEAAAEPLCMTTEEADEIIEAYRLIIAEYTEEIGEKYLANDFIDISQSINTFIHLPLDGPTFPNKEIFMEVQAWNQHFPIEILSVDAIQCNTIALQWVAAFGAANLPSKGITVMKSVWEEDMWRISSIEVEFNALTWLLNMGGSYSWEGKTYTPESPDPAILGETPAMEEEMEE